MINQDVAQEILHELFSSLEALDTQCTAMLQFLKDKGIAKEEELAVHFEQAGNASSVRWRAARVRIDHLLSSAVKAEERESPKAEEQQSAKAQGEEQQSAKAAGGGSAKAKEQEPAKAEEWKSRKSSGKMQESSRPEQTEASPERENQRPGQPVATGKAEVHDGDASVANKRKEENDRTTKKTEDAAA